MHKRFFLLLIISMLFSFLSINNAAALADNESGKKAIIIIMDYVDLPDLINADTPQLDYLLQNSGSALINIRAKNRNPSSSCMSLSSGSRTATLYNAKLSYNDNEVINSLPGIYQSNNTVLTAGDLYYLYTGIKAPAAAIVNLYTEPMKKYASSFNPVYEIGYLGSLARDYGLNVAVLGNSDTLDSLDRNIAILGMDENGLVPHGDVSKKILEHDASSLGGLRTNHQAFLSRLDEFLEDSDIMFIDLGDSSRVEYSRDNCADELLYLHRQNAIERNDRLLGEIIAKLDMEHTMLFVLSPNTNKDMVSQGNFGLTAAIVYNPDFKQGFLTSPTTRRAGLISNIDILPSILGYLDCPQPGGNTGINVIPSNNNSLEILHQDLNLFKQLRKSRNPLHYSFMFLAFLSILLGFLVFIMKKEHLWPYLYTIIYSTWSLPIIYLFIARTGYPSVLLSVFLSLVAALAAGLLLNRVFRKAEPPLFLLSSITSIFLVIDCFRGSPLMLLSPLGSDAIAGGRFYGIGNDYMGILLATTVIAVSILLNRLSLSPRWKALIGVLPLSLAALAIGHPHFGANVGGLISAIVIIGVFMLVVLDKKISLKNMIIIGIAAFLGILLVAQLDLIFSDTPSHAGNTINSLLHSGPALFFSIVKIKLGILISTVYNSNWSILLLFSLFILIISWKKEAALFRQIVSKQHDLHNSIRILPAAALIIFLVNDTGVIAAALVTVYMICCLWIAFGNSAYRWRGER
jgi:hypothetical protein